MATLIRHDEVPTLHVPDAAVQGLRALTRLRADLGGQIGDGKRRVITVLDRTFAECAPCFGDIFGLTARAVLEEWAWPEPLAAGPTAQLTALMSQISRGHGRAAKAQAVHDAAQQSVGVRRGAEALAFELRLLLRQVGYLESQGKELEQAIGQRYRQLDTSLLTIPAPLAFLPSCSMAAFLPSIGGLSGVLSAHLLALFFLSLSLKCPIKRQISHKFYLTSDI